MSSRNDKYRTKITAACQPNVPEPIAAVGVFQPHGSAGAAAMTAVGFHLMGAAMEGDAQSRAGNVPKTGLYALTDSALHLMEGKPKGFGWKVTNYVGNWPLDAFQARAVAGKVTDQVELDFGDGSVLRLESIRAGSQGFNEDIISRLIERSL